MTRKVLFLSGIDFKEKSIQVIIKTPLAYAEAGWEVDYIVARDNTQYGNYFYEQELNPSELRIERFYWPLEKLRSKKWPYVLHLLLAKTASLIVACKLFLKARKKLSQFKYDVVYGYEVQGALALKLLRLFSGLKDQKTVTRFQGTFLNEMLENKQYLRQLFNFDLIWALKTPSDLLIMTNDGTQGDQALDKLRRSQKGTVYFWPNGVDQFEISDDEVRRLESELVVSGKTVFLSLSRLIAWKRVDRGIRLMRSLKDQGLNDFVFLIVGEGNERPKLEALARELQVQDYVKFVGAVKQSMVPPFYALTDFFLSFYDSSNVGNPLLEAIRMNKIIVTLDNGDTGKWIQHGKNGLIYPVNDSFFDSCARDIANLIEDKDKFRKLQDGVKELELQKTWTWKERLEEEVSTVTKMFSSKP